MQEEIDGMDQYENNGFLDTFRYLNPDMNKYSWWSYRAGGKTAKYWLENRLFSCLQTMDR